MPLTPLQILANPPQDAPSLHPFHGPWLTQGLLPIVSGLVSPPTQERWVSPVAGNLAANGSAADPFNPTSAAALFGGDPLAQAFGSFPIATTPEQEASGYRVHVAAGFYPAPVVVDLSALRVVFILCAGPAVFPSALFQRLCGPGLGSGFPPIFAISCQFNAPLGSQFFQTGGATIVQFGGDESPSVFAAVLAAFGAGSLVSIVGGTVQPFVVWQSITGGTIDVGALGQVQLFPGSAIFGALVAGTLAVAEGCTFPPSVTVATVGPPIRGAVWYGGGPPTWTGPVGSARFDPATAQAFAEAPAPHTFVGGAGPLDYWRPDTITDQALLTLVVPGVVSADFVAGQNRRAARAWVTPRGVPIVGGPCDLTLTINGFAVCLPFSLVGLPANVPTAVPLFPWPSNAPEASTGDVVSVAIASALGTVGGPVGFSVDFQRDARPLF